MKSKIAGVVLFSVVFGVCAAYADSHERTVAIWTCKRADGKTEADVQSANAQWVKYVNAQLDEGEIRSYVLTTIVGDQASFLYIDSFPSGMAWVASREAMKSDEGQAIEKALEEAATCSRNSLHESIQTMPAK